jgi:ribose transport system permease protein
MRNKTKIEFMTKYRTILVLIFICIIASLISPVFFSLSNFTNVIRQTSIIAILASGMTFVILTGGIDLSVGAVLAISGAVGAGVMQSTDSLLLSILSIMFIGSILGLSNGLLITKFNMPPFISSLAIMVIARGATLVYTNGYPLAIKSSQFRFIGRGSFMGIYIPILILIIVYILSIYLLNNTKFGRYVISTGGNEEATRLSGINVNKVKISVYTISGFLAAIAGLILTARLSSAQPTAGTGLELDAIAAVILGGTSLSGGLGTISGTLIGSLILGVLNNILNLANVNPFYQDIVKGLVIIIAVITDGKFKAMSLKMMNED